MKIICFDLDGTICTEERTFRKQYAKPHKQIVELINKLYDEGHHIIIFTGRNSLEWQATRDWLLENNVKYHQLIMNKPFFDYYICDRAICFDHPKGIEEIYRKITGAKRELKNEE